LDAKELCPLLMFGLQNDVIVYDVDTACMMECVYSGKIYNTDLESMGKIGRVYWK
jgi:hypothetical protein